MPKRKEDPRTAFVGVRVSKRVHDIIKVMASAEDKSISDIVREALYDFLEGKLEDLRGSIQGRGKR